MPAPPHEHLGEPVGRDGATRAQEDRVHRGASVPRRRLVRWLLVLVVGLFMLAAAVLAWERTSPLLGDRMIYLIADGDRIINAVLRYRADTGSIPARLEDLVPNYLKVMPRSHYGEWVLVPAGPNRLANDEFRVEFSVDEWRRYRTECESISCYVVIDKAAVWEIIPGSWSNDSDEVSIRHAGVPWNPPQPRP